LSLYQSLVIPSFHNESKIREMLRSANACGAIITTKKGAIPALPTPDEVHKHKFLLLSTQ